MPGCANCASKLTVKNGHIHNGKQRFRCQHCGRQFIKNPQKKVIGPATRELIDRLLLEGISLADIARLTKVSEQWLQTYVNENTLQHQLNTGKSKKDCLTIQYDELWSCVDNKGNKQWVWFALDANNREIVGVYIGTRDESSARKSWQSLPPIYSIT